MRRNHLFQRLAVFSTCLLLSLTAGCGSIGPKTMDRDQLNYGHSIGNNWKNQMLANIVKLRYVDMPVFVDVGSIVSGYTLETQVNARVGFSDSFTGGDSQGLGAGGRYTDRPTITYMPKTGDAYLRSLLEPVQPRNLLALVQAGYSAELLFTWAVEAINDVHNYTVTSSRRTEADPEFHEFMQTLQDLQNSGHIGFELEHDPETSHDVIFVLRRENPSETTLAKRSRVREILQLNSGRQHYRVIYAPFRTDGDTLAIQTRSVLQTLIAMSGFIEVPEAHSEQVAPGYRIRSDIPRPFMVRSGPERPDDSFAAVRYRDFWFWIDNDDLFSKRVFTLMLFLTTLTNQASDDAGPVLTIPTG